MLHDLWEKVKRGVRRVKAFFTRRRKIEAVAFVATLSLSVYVMRLFLPAWLVFMFAIVTVLHELAHYITALRYGQEPNMPYFIPLVYAFVGATYVEGEDPTAHMTISLIGPIVGMAVAATLAAACAYLRFFPGMIAALWLLAFQIFHFTFGGDGRRHRRYQRAANRNGLSVVGPSAAHAV
jgi:hypothetical protein